MLESQDEIQTWVPKVLEFVTNTDDTIETDSKVTPVSITLPENGRCVDSVLEDVRQLFPGLIYCLYYSHVIV